MIGKFVKYVKEVKTEMKKVSWPSRKELVGSTIVTIVVTLIVSIFIGIVDRLLQTATFWVFK